MEFIQNDFLVTNQKEEEFFFVFRVPEGKKWQ